MASAPLPHFSPSTAGALSRKVPDARTGVDSPAPDRRYQVHLAVGADRREPRVLEDFPIDGDGITLAQVRGELRKALAQRAQQLTHIGCVELHFSSASGELLQRAAEDYACHVARLSCDFYAG